MARPRKHPLPSTSSRKTRQSTKMNLHNASKNDQLAEVITQAGLEEVESMEFEDPDDLIVFDNQILSPPSSLSDLQHQSQVHDVFNPWINGVSAGKPISSH